MEDIENKLKEISKKTGVKDVRNLPTVRFFKSRVDFDMEEWRGAGREGWRSE